MAENRPDIEVRYGDGTVRAREVLGIVFYFNRPHIELRDAIQSAIWKFVELVNFDSLPYHYNFDGEQEDLTAEALLEIIQDRFFGPHSAPNANIELIGHGVNAAEFYLWYNGKALGRPEFADEVGFLWCWVPRHFFLTNFEHMVAYVRHVATHTPFASGYASLAVASDAKSLKHALAKRYWGLDIASPGAVSADLDTRAAGSYWLSLLGQQITSRLGGIEAIRNALGSELKVEEIPHEQTMILLEPEPRLADRNRRETLPKHQAFARFLNSHGLLHVPQEVVYFEDDQGMADREAQTAWHRGFLQQL